MHVWHDVRDERVKPNEFLALIEISKGSKNKYELDKETGHLILDRVLYTSTIYPQNYGFIPKTYASDNDPLDVLVLCSEPILPMSFIECEPIGVLLMTDNGFLDEKIIAVAKKDPFYNQYKDICDLPNHIFEEIRHFFSVYKTLEGKQTLVEEIKNRDEAVKIIIKSLQKYKDEVAPKVEAERMKYFKQL